MSTATIYYEWSYEPDDAEHQQRLQPFRGQRTHESILNSSNHLLSAQMTIK